MFLVGLNLELLNLVVIIPYTFGHVEVVSRLCLLSICPRVPTRETDHGCRLFLWHVGNCVTLVTIWNITAPFY